MMRGAALLLAAAGLMVRALPAAEVSLGPEVALAPSSAASQDSVQLARGPSGVFAVWIEGKQTIAGLFNGKALAIANSDEPDLHVPTIAVGGRVVLVVWHQGDPRAGDDRMSVMRFDFDGNALDPRPITLPINDITILAPGTHAAPAIAFDGSSFLLAWTTIAHAGPVLKTSSTLHTVRVGEAGAPFDRREMVVTPYRWSEAHFPRLVWTGSEMLVAYTLDWTSSQPVFDPPTALAVRRLSQISASEASVVPAFDEIGDKYTQVVRFGMSRANESVSFVWRGFDSVSGGIVAAQTALDGRPTRAPRVLVTRPSLGVGPAHPEIVWNGSELVIAWTELSNWDPASRTGSVRAIRLDMNLEPIDSVPIEIASNVTESRPPALISTPTGVLIAYDRVDADHGGVQRAFMRTLDRLLPLPVHRRAVGH